MAAGRAVFTWGSGECDQLGIDGLTEAKLPKLLSFPTAVVAATVSCGGMHTALITTTGALYTWGCNDDGALGREGLESTPGLVTGLPPLRAVSTGDSHTVALSADSSSVFAWGTYRDAQGNMKIAERAPAVIGKSQFRHRQGVTKVVSGAHHTLVLVGGKVFAWGDSDSGQIGRIPAVRNRTQSSLTIESMGLRKIKDIFSGAYHSFALDERGRVFAWGLNNRGQLGDGKTVTTCRPHEIHTLSELDVLSIQGGEHHSVALTKDGRVFAWGKNDDCQLGQGENNEEEYKEPKHVSGLTDVMSIAIGSQYNLALDRNQRLFAWGMGDCYVLGNKQETNLSVPTHVQTTANLHVICVAAGSQHVAIVADPATQLQPGPVELKRKRSASADRDDPPSKMLAS